MKIRVNGRDMTFEGGSVGDLLAYLGLSGARVVVERNGAVVHRQDHGSTSLEEGDSLEVVRMVGGG